jgi:hypothetical protein
MTDLSKTTEALFSTSFYGLAWQMQSIFYEKQHSAAVSHTDLPSAFRLC